MHLQLQDVQDHMFEVPYFPDAFNLFGLHNSCLIWNSHLYGFTGYIAYNHLYECFLFSGKKNLNMMGSFLNIF